MTLKPPPLRDDCFALPAGVQWTPVDEALSLLRERLQPVTGEEILSLVIFDGVCTALLTLQRREFDASEAAAETPEASAQAQALRLLQAAVDKEVRRWIL